MPFFKRCQATLSHTCSHVTDLTVKHLVSSTYGAHHVGIFLLLSRAVIIAVSWGRCSVCSCIASFAVVRLDWSRWKLGNGHCLGILSFGLGLGPGLLLFFLLTLHLLTVALLILKGDATIDLQNEFLMQPTASPNTLDFFYSGFHHRPSLLEELHQSLKSNFLQDSALDNISCRSDLLSVPAGKFATRCSLDFDNLFEARSIQELL